MRMNFRAAQPSDLEACATINADRFLYDSEATARLVRFWKETLASGCGVSSVIEDEERSNTQRIVGFGMSLFLREHFAQDLKRQPSPYVAKRVFDKWSEGRSPLLTFEELRRTNSGQGLIVLGSHYGLAPRLTPDEIVNMVSYMAQAFVAIHRGFLVKEILIEALGPFALSRLLADGAKLVTDHEDFFRVSAVRPSPDRHPYLTSSIREDVLGFESSPFGLVFLSYVPPRFHFSPLEQNLLLGALSGQTDEQLSHALGFAPITVKKRWQTIYARVDSVTPDLLPSSTKGQRLGSRGGENRRHLLIYLRDHPEELRPHLPITGGSTLARSRRRQLSAAYRFVGGRPQPLRSLDAHLHNLPIQLTSFIGRECEMADVKTLLSTTRLLTLTGVGGAGKTRLALQVAADLIEEYPDGIWFVELASLAEPDLVPQVVASTLRVPEQPGRPPTETLVDHLRSKSQFLVLDNCEHLLPACAALVDTLLRACTSLRILATSRENLGVPGERLYPVPALPVPDPQQLPSIGDLAQYDVVRLFSERAAAVAPLFRVTPQNAPAVAQLCHRLDGIPLAIELAAARTKVLTPAEIAARLDDRFRLLTGGVRMALPHHQTLRAAIDWSYGLLSEKEGAVLRRLAVFAGGWSLESAEAVCVGNAVEPSEILDLLTHLAEKSLVLVETSEGVSRYRFLETVRQYALDRLIESGEAPTVRNLHREWCLTFAEREGPELHGGERTAWRQRLERELDNLRAALAWSLEQNPEAGLRLAGALGQFWRWPMVSGGSTRGRGYYEEGWTWLKKLLEKSPTSSPPVRAKALLDAGYLSWTLGEFRHAASLSEKGLALCRQMGDKSGIASSLYLKALTEKISGNLDEAARLFEDSQNLYREVGDRVRMSDALGHRGHIAALRGHYALATALLEKALASFREIGFRRGIAMSLLHLGVTKDYQGHSREAVQLLEQSLALIRELKLAEGCNLALVKLGSALRQEGNYTRALSLYKESLVLSRDHGTKRYIMHGLLGLAGMHARQGQPERAARLLGAGEATREAIEVSLWPPDQADYEGSLAAIRAALGDAAFAAAWAEGRAMRLEQAIEYALEERTRDE